MNPTSTGKITNRYYYHTNQLGSVIAISTSTGQVVQKYIYNAYGKPYIYSGSTLTPLSNYTGTLYGNTRLYTGREYDRETGYYYLRARIYSPDLGRFLSRDPVGQNDQVNLYTYVKNSPLNYTDRNGKSSKSLNKKHDATALFEKDMKDIRKDNFLKKVAKSGFIDDSYNPKMRSDYRDLTFDPSTKESCAGENYSSNCITYFDGQEYKLDQLGNMLIGYGYTYSYMPKDLIYFAGLSVELIKNNLNPIKANLNEIDDRPYYDKGIEIAVDQISSTFEASLKFIEILKDNYHLMY